MKPPKTIEIVEHFDKDDEDFSGDYLSIEIFVNGKKAISYGDYYHEKGDIAAEAFVEGLNFAFGTDVKPTYTQKADGKY